MVAPNVITETTTTMTISTGLTGSSAYRYHCIGGN
jgi:hypothetical protein